MKLSLDPLENIEPHQWHSPPVTASDQSKVEKFIKSDTKTNQQYKGWDRLKSKFERPDAESIARSLSRYIEVHQDDCSLPVVQGFLDLLPKTQPPELQPLVNAVLRTVVKRKQAFLVPAFASLSSQQSRNEALLQAVENVDHETVKELIAHGAKPTNIAFEELAKLIETDSHLFDYIIRAQQPCTIHELSALCSIAIQTRHLVAMILVLRKLRHEFTPVADTVKCRDIFLRTAIEMRQFQFFIAIARITYDWGLQDESLIQVAVESTHSTSQQRLQTLEVLLCLSQKSPATYGLSTIKRALKKCVDQCDKNALSLMASFQVPVPLEVLKYVCLPGNDQLLKVILKSTLYISESFWPFLVGTSGHSITDTQRQRIVTKLLLEKVQIPCKERLLVLAIQDGQLDLVSSLLLAGAETDHNQGEPIAAAVLSENTSLVQNMLAAKQIQNLERAYLATQVVAPSSRKAMTELILHKLYCGPAISYILLNMLANSSIIFEGNTFLLLTKAILAHKPLHNEDEKFWHDREVLAASLHTKKEIQHLRRSEKVDRNIVLENAWKDFQLGSSHDEIACRLLHSHLTECTQRIGHRRAWPLGIICLLKKRIDKSLEDYSRCLHLAVFSEQWTVFEMLMDPKDFPRKHFENLPIVKSEIIPHAAHIIFKFADTWCGSEADYGNVMGPVLRHASEIGRLDKLIPLLSQSRWRLHDQDMIDILKHAFKCGVKADCIASILEFNTVDQAGIEAVWDFIWDLGGATFVSGAPVLLRAGISGPKIESTLLKSVAEVRSVELVAAILEPWQKIASATEPPQYDYQERKAIHSSRKAGAEENLFYAATSVALEEATRTGRFELCCILCKYGTPMVWRGKSMIEIAVENGNNISTLEQDLILHFLVQTFKDSEDYQSVLDFTLLKAVEFDRACLVVSLCQAGASSLAYNNECWYKAFQSHSKPSPPKSTLPEQRDSKEGQPTPESSTLHALWSVAQTREQFKTIFDKFFKSSLCSQVSTDETCRNLETAYKMGLESPQLFSWALLHLCGSQWATPENIGNLLRSGASIEHESSGCLKATYKHRKVEAFKYLSGKCSRSSRAGIYIDMCKGICFLGDGFFHDKHGPHLLQFLEGIIQGGGNPISTSALNRGLSYLIRKEFIWNDWFPVVLPALLKNGARFESDMGDLLWLCYLSRHLNIRDMLNSIKHCLPARTLALKDLLENVATPPKRLRERLRGNDALQVMNSLLAVPQSIPLHLDIETYAEIIYILLKAGVSPSVELTERFLFAKEIVRPVSGSPLDEVVSAFSRHLKEAIEASVHDSALRRIELVLVATQLRDKARPNRCDDPLYIGVQHLNELLLSAAERGLKTIFQRLLDAGAELKVRNAQGHSTMHLAAVSDHHSLVDYLLDKGMQVDETLFKIVVRKQNHHTLRFLLTHKKWKVPMNGRSIFSDFVNHQHPSECAPKFRETLGLFLKHKGPPGSGGKDGSWLTQGLITLHLRAALRQQFVAYELCRALLERLSPGTAAVERSIAEVHCEGDLRYSLLSLIEKWDGITLSVEQRVDLVRRLQQLGYNHVYYAEEGAQPDDAIGVPTHLLEREQARKRRIAFETKECCVCGDKPQTDNEIHAGLVPACDTIHGWNDQIICTDCLRLTIEARMFPLESDGSTTHQFAAREVQCWAPGCQSTALDHATLAKYVSASMFAKYDEALLQQHLRSALSVRKCAGERCPISYWHDDDDDKDLEKWTCRMCHAVTCCHCNNLVESHPNRVCPVAEAQKDERLKKEEELSEATLQNNRCPICKLPYVKNRDEGGLGGCDHIVCGRSSTEKPGSGRKLSRLSPLPYHKHMYQLNAEVYTLIPQNKYTNISNRWLRT